MEPTINDAIPSPQTGGKRLASTPKKKTLPVILGIVAALLAVYLCLCVYTSKRNTIFPGITIVSTDLGGQTVQQATSALSEANLMIAPSITMNIVDENGNLLSLPDYETALDFEDLGGVQIDSAASAQKVWDYCHGGSFFSSGWRFLKSALLHQVITPVLTAPNLNEQALAERISLPAVDAAYQLGENSVAVTMPRNGYSVAPAALREVIAAGLADYDFVVMDCPGTPVIAQTLTAQEILDQVSGKMKNAGYDPVSKSITPEQVGANFDVAAAQALMDAAQPGETISVPADIQMPDVTAEELNKVLFRDLLGECTTEVRGSSARRSNVRLSSASFNGYVLNDGEVFSYNGVVGKRTTAKGYQAAPAYVKGETVDEIGGGVCQPSSTLYLACLRADLQITERYAHRYIPSYIPAGMDATVSWGGPDYKFTNNTGYPLRIETIYAKNKLTIKIWGTNADGISAKITNKHLSTTPFQEVIEEDPTLAPGTTKVKVTPYTGHKYQTYRNRYDANGKLISSSFEANSDYKARDKVILKGPDAAPSVPSVTPAPLPETPPATTPENPETLPPSPEVLPPAPPETVPEAPEFIIQDPEIAA